MSRFLSGRYNGMLPYTPGEQPQDKRYIKLNTNENPFPPSPRAVAAVSQEVLENLKLYSDPEATKCTLAVAEYYGVDPDCVLMTNGSDEALAFVYMAFCDKQREIIAPDISYGFYPVFCELLNLKYNFIPLKDDYKVDVDAFCGINKNIIIANPNAPTGLAITVDEVAKITASNPDNVVIIDEAYMDFGTQSAVPLLQKFDNLIIVSTFSKSRSLAGGRLGYILSSREVIDDIKKIKYSFNPYNVNRVTDLMGKYAMEDVEYFKECVGKVVANRAFLTEKLRSLGFTVLDSQANFIFAKREGISGEKLYFRLKEKAILVRHFNKERIADFVRISVGSREEIDMLLAAVGEILAEEGVL